MGEVTPRRHLAELATREKPKRREGEARWIFGARVREQWSTRRLRFQQRRQSVACSRNMQGLSVAGAQVARKKLERCEVREAVGRDFITSLISH